MLEIPNQEDFLLESLAQSILTQTIFYTEWGFYQNVV